MVGEGHRVRRIHLRFPEYNRNLLAALKNALDFLYVEWNDNAAGMLCYGSSGGLRAAEQLKSVLGELQVATVRAL